MMRETFSGFYKYELQKVKKKWHLIGWKGIKDASFGPNLFPATKFEEKRKVALVDCFNKNANDILRKDYIPS